MKAAVLHQPGEPENLVIEERPTPKPGQDQVLIRVRAFGLNRSELMTRRGLSPTVKFPRILGIECVGEVTDDPSGEYPKGQKVMAFMGEMGRQYDGSYAEYTAVPKSITHPIQSALPWETLGAIPEMYQTVHGSLFAALNVEPGESLLVRGGTSSVGMLAAQVAKNHGLTIISTTRNQAKEGLLRKNGVSHVIIDNGALSDKVKSIFSSGVDKVLELVGAGTLRDSLQCARPGGTVCITGMLSEIWSIQEFAPMEFIPATVKLTTYDSGQTRSPAAAFQKLINQVEAGEMEIAPARVFSLDEIVQAHQLMESNRANGKLVVLP